MKDETVKRLYAEYRKYNRLELEMLIADLGEFLPLQLTLGSTACFGWL
jgi:hypothetical protein